MAHFKDPTILGALPLQNEHRACIETHKDMQERLDTALKAAKEMQRCENGMCGHCIEVLCEELLPALGDETGP